MMEMKDNEIVLTIQKDGLIRLPLGFRVINKLEEGDRVKVIIEKEEEQDND